MRTRALGPFEVSAIGFGCMSLSHAYGAPPPREDAIKVLNEALDLGCTHLDTAALYGFGANEALIGDALWRRRGEFVLASKCGMTGVNGKRVIDGRPQTIKRTCEESLARLQTDIIDLYYLHRWDKSIPIEESVGALGDLVRAGKVKAIGLSEVSAATLRRAHRTHPIAAVQSEYSLWTRNPEIAVLAACRELNVSFVAFSPIARGFLAGGVSAAAQFGEGDIRRHMPRFQGENLAANLALLKEFARIAAELGCKMSRLALAWTLAKDVTPIPGTTRLQHLAENVGAAELCLSADTLARLERLFEPAAVRGARYNAATQAEIDTEDAPVPA
jgi:aryl-alcohol dehydrogenase-like predicted oxidoreductase